jgi:hypothetical protein
MLTPIDLTAESSSNEQMFSRWRMRNRREPARIAAAVGFSYTIGSDLVK